MDEAAFREQFRGSPVLCATRRGLVCQAAYALGNRPDPKAIPALTEGLQDADPAVREACRWALNSKKLQELAHGDDSRVPVGP